MPDPNQDKPTTLQQIFDERAINVSKLAENIGINHQTLRRIIRGAHLPRVDRAIKIARALDLRVEDIWGLKEDESD